jgi:hypothetical protein
VTSGDETLDNPYGLELLTPEECEERDRRIAEEQFQQPYWPLEWVRCWIVLRDRHQLEANWRDAQRAAKRYSPGSVVELSNPDNLLRKALKANKLKGIVDGEEKPSVYWVNDRLFPPDIRFRKTEVVRAWKWSRSAPHSNIACENEARVWLVPRLKENPNMTFDQARGDCEEFLLEKHKLNKNGPAPLSERGFLTSAR